MCNTPHTHKFKDVRISVPWGHVVGRWYGNTQLRPILALHGWQDNIGTWDTLIPLLPQHIGILCIDLPGHGLSSRYPKGIRYHVFDYVQIIVRIMKEYKWPKVSLMGHSMGVTVGFIYASIYPHTVDLFVCLDTVGPVYRDVAFQIERNTQTIDKTIIEDERVDMLAIQEPTTYTYNEMEHILHKGTRKSLDLSSTKYILNRSIIKSTKFPNRYYFSRDGRMKYIVVFIVPAALGEEMAKRIRNVPVFITKATKSRYIDESYERTIAVLREQNQHFEFHILDGTHHVNLNNPNEVAKLLNPFISHHRPASLDAWSLSERYGRQDEDVEALPPRNNSSVFKQISKL